jgi:hypothetical protein
MKKIKVLYTSLVDFTKDDGPAINESTFIKFTSKMQDVDLSLLTINFKDNKNVQSKFFYSFHEFPIFISWILIRIINTIVFYKVVKKINPDIIIIRVPSFPLLYFFPLLFLKHPFYLKTAGSLVFNGFYKKSLIRFIFYPFNEIMYYYLAHKAILVEMTGDQFKSSLVNKYKLNPSKVFVLENGFDDLIYNNFIDSKFFKNPLKLIYLGNFPYRRGGLFLIRVVEYLNSKYPEIEIESTIIGDSGDLDKLKSYMVNKKLNIKFLGEIPYAKTAQFLSNSHIGFSITEGEEKLASEQKVRQYLASGMFVISNTINNKYHLECTYGCYTEDITQAGEFVREIYGINLIEFNKKIVEIREYAVKNLSYSVLNAKRFENIKKIII